LKIQRTYNLETGSQSHIEGRVNIPKRFAGRLTKTSWCCGYRDGYDEAGDHSDLRTPKSEAQEAYKDGYAFGQKRREKREAKVA